MMVPALVALIAAATSPGEAGTPPGFKLSNLFSDSMVLQAEAPTVFGTCDKQPGCNIKVTLAGATNSVPCQHDGSWKAMFAALPASKPTEPGMEVAVEYSCGAAHPPPPPILLTDVLLGDVWVCGGQSNMEFSVAESFGYDGNVGSLIPTADKPGLRLFAVQKNASSSPLVEAVDLQYSEGWVRSTPSTACGAEYHNDGYNPPSNASAYCAPHCGPSATVKSFSRATWGYFSAVCHATGAALLRDTGRPQGMIESCWGGTKIQPWTPAAPDVSSQHQAMDHQPIAVDEMGPGGAGSLYNGMIAPLLKFPIKGAVWYQGESNAGQFNDYAKQMRELIAGWRQNWESPQALQNFTFIEHQLSAYSGTEGAVSGLRWSQQGAVSPWADNTLPGGNVAMTVGIDLSDPGSPCGNVHIRNKTAVAERMALAARYFAYGHNIKFTGPVAQSFDVNSNGIVITFSGATSPLGFRTIAQTTDSSQQGFELMYATMGTDDLHSGGVNTTENFTWVAATASVIGENDRVLVKPPTIAAGKSPLAIRYAWRSIPMTQLLYDSTPVGGGYGGLPAPPFFANCSGDGTCNLVPPGMLPASAGGSMGGGGKPGHKLPVAPWAPPSTACTFMNNTTVGANPIASGLVTFLDQAACCGMCRAYKGCVAAELMGAGHRNPPFPTSACNLYGAVGKQSHYTCDWPCARMAVVPTK